jgi:hypothetical protein
MRSYEARAAIDADPADVWKVTWSGGIWRSMPDLGPSFTRFADGLKARVEAGA